MIQIKLVGTAMIIQRTKLNLPMCNGTCVLSIKYNVNFKFQLSAMLVILDFAKVILL
jgi:hypothetical protein